MEDMDDGVLEGSPLFKPKVIIILSRFPFFDLFRVGRISMYCTFFNFLIFFFLLLGAF